jgi:uncharacterized protein YaiI (UPF0178 family)
MKTDATLLIDADSCPRQLRAIILKAAVNRKIPTLFVADRLLTDVVEIENKKLVDENGIKLVTMVVVEQKEGSADDKIVELADKGKITITRDIPLANRLVALDVVVLDDRGSVFTEENIKERLSVRNLMTDLREAGLFIERTKPLGSKEIQLFSNALDRELTKVVKQNEQ